MKILLLGYLYNIHQDRELIRQVPDRMSFRWFIGCDIDKAIRDNSSTSYYFAFTGSLFHRLDKSPLFHIPR